MGVYKPFTVTGGHFCVGLFLPVAGRNQKKVHWSQLVAAASYFLLVLFLFLVGPPPMFRLVKCSKRSALFLAGKHMQICFPVTPPILNISIIYKCLYRWVYMLQMGTQFYCQVKMAKSTGYLKTHQPPAESSKELRLPLRAKRPGKSSKTSGPSIPEVGVTFTPGSWSPTVYIDKTPGV